MAAAPGARHVQGQFDGAEQGGWGRAGDGGQQQAEGTKKAKKARKPRSAEQEEQYKAKNKQRH
jgi:hypothetical protein